MGLLDGKVAIVTGAGGGLGREHALALAAEGASIVVNDLGGARDGSGSGSAMADLVCNDIKAAGGEAVDLSRKMLRPMHVGALFAAVERYRVAELDLEYNQLGAAGGALVAAALKTNTTLTTLMCAQLGRPLEPSAKGWLSC